MLPAMHDAMVRGIRVNRAEVTQLTTQFHHEMIETRDKVSGLCGRTMFTVKTKVEKAILDAYESGLRDISAITAYVERQGLLGASVPKKFQEQQEKGISDTLLGMVLQGRRARGRKRTASGSVKTDAVALRRIAIESEGRDDIVTQIVDLTLQHRRAQKLRSMLKDEKIDDDGRFRCSYKFTPWSGRFSSSKSPSGKGDNLQNRDRSLKSLFVADPGCVLVQVDLSQAENRVVSALTGDSEMIRKARLLPGEWDEHTHNAELIFSEIEQRTVTKDMFAPEEWATRRFLGKVVTHASGYGLGPTKLADILLKVGLVRTLQECKMLLAASLSARPAIPVWQRETRELLLKTRTLVNSWGRTFYFQYDRLDDELYRKGYACIPQSEVGDLMNQYGWLPLYTFLQEKQMQSYIVLQVHDALVVNCLPEEVYTVMKTLRDALEQPRWYGGVFGRQVELVIPCEFSLGPTWKSIAEWKRFPTAQDVEKAVEKALIYGKSARCL
jgi:DNA polymerase I-like protein with 3'-5' exonuclease and polymerase domains